MRYLITICLIFIVNLAFTQVIIGHTEEYIRQQLLPEEPIYVGYINEDTRLIEYNYADGQIGYYFSEGECFCTVLIPNNQDTIDEYILFYNENYEVQCPYLWYEYYDDGILEGRLVYEEEKASFIWRMIDK